MGSVNTEEKLENNPETKEEYNIELHLHPYFNAYSPGHVVDAMQSRSIDILALEYLDGSAFSDAEKRFKEHFSKEGGYCVDSDDTAMRVESEEDGRQLYILRAKELGTREGYHVLTIGSDDQEPGSPIRSIIDSTIEKGAIAIFDHPFVENGNLRKRVSESKRKDIRDICVKYEPELFLEWNGYCIPWLRKLMLGGDVNREVVDFSNEWSRYGKNFPVVSDSDIHARTRRALYDMGTAGITTPGINTSSGMEIIKSLKENIIRGDYTNTHKTVSLSHFVCNFGIPYLTGSVFDRPRG